MTVREKALQAFSKQVENTFNASKKELEALLSIVLPGYDPDDITIVPAMNGRAEACIHSVPQIRLYKSSLDSRRLIAETPTSEYVMQIDSWETLGAAIAGIENKDATSAARI